MRLPFLATAATLVVTALLSTGHAALAWGTDFPPAGPNGTSVSPTHGTFGSPLHSISEFPPHGGVGQPLGHDKVPVVKRDVAHLSNRHYGVEYQCTTPSGKRGVCRALHHCPPHLNGYDTERESFCLVGHYVMVCCPYHTTSTGEVNNVSPPHGGRPSRPSYSHPTTSSPDVYEPDTFDHPPDTIYNFTDVVPHYQFASVPSKPSTGVPPKQSAGVPPNQSAGVPPNQSAGSPPNQSAGVPFKKPRCGVAQTSKQRIVGGESSVRATWPWMVVIFEKKAYLCGGSLVNRRYVLTAAHCMQSKKPELLSILVGDHNIFSEEDDHLGKPARYRVAEIKSHPQFTSETLNSDIALLYLKTDVQMNEFVSHVCLPPFEIQNKSIDYLAGVNATVIGYGALLYKGKDARAARNKTGHRSEELREVQVPIWNHEECNRAYSGSITEAYMCAGYKEGALDSCQGDSGGPMQILSQGRQWVQVGIVSYGYKCAWPGYPGVYTRVSNYLTWIKKTMET